MSALFTLNLYFKNEVFYLGKEKSIMNLPINMGSEIFTIKLNEWNGHDFYGNYKKEKDFEQCIYIVRLTDKFKQDLFNANIKMRLMEQKMFHEHPKFLQYSKEKI